MNKKVMRHKAICDELNACTNERTMTTATASIRPL